MNELKNIDELFSDAVGLLKQLISTPSFSKEENKTADLLENFLQQKNIKANRYLNNVWAVNKHFDENKKTLLLNSHHDTVKPNNGYTLNPFEAIEKDGKLYGLGSNDAGGPLVSLLSVFLYFYEASLPFNLLFAGTAEEEISGQNGVEILLNYLPKIDCAIVGEPTLLNMAVAEKGLLVLDCIAHGKAGHAARNEGVNALYIAMKDINWLSTIEFPKVSSLLGPVHIAVTSVTTPNQTHNIVPDECHFLVDIRVNEFYTFDEVIATIKKNISSQIQPRSIRLNSSFIKEDHPLVLAGKRMGLSSYGSPTCSDMALMHFPSLKIGPGDSARSHSADEFIFVNEIKEGIKTYIQLLQNFEIELKHSVNKG
ncbi:MAG: M20 family metallo-hydrolase [Bacteroidota bacterium]|nr:M20 family metallo-hydrolase [Bacteroidota bacterium]